MLMTRADRTIERIHEADSRVSRRNTFLGNRFSTSQSRMSRVANALNGPNLFIKNRASRLDTKIYFLKMVLKRWSYRIFDVPEVVLGKGPCRWDNCWLETWVSLRMRSTGKGACMEASKVIGHLRFLFPVFNLSTDLYATHETQKGMEENINMYSFANSS